MLDLWSIIDFDAATSVQRRTFAKGYERLTRDKDEAVQARLGRRLRPFILRRLKTEVAKDLPAKIQQVSFCELTDDQAQIYKQVLAVSRKEVMDAVGAQGVAKSKMIVLNALLRLRQICCDLRLLKLENAEFTDDSSGKLAMFGELLEEAMDGGHRVLVFSQFTTMLALLKDKLRRRTLSSATSMARRRIAAPSSRNSRATRRFPFFSSASRLAAWVSRSPARTRSSTSTRGGIRRWKTRPRIAPTASARHA